MQTVTKYVVVPAVNFAMETETTFRMKSAVLITEVDFFSLTCRVSFDVTSAYKVRLIKRDLTEKNAK